MKHYSPSSDDSPIDHRHTVRLSDFRHVAPRPAVLDAPPAASAFARAENQRGLDALSVIHGSQSSLRSSIQQERQRIHTVTEEVQANTSALFQSPHRRPPHPPVSANVSPYCFAASTAMKIHYSPNISLSDRLIHMSRRICTNPLIIHLFIVHKLLATQGAFDRSRHLPSCKFLMCLSVLDPDYPA